ncbi:MAG: hypothetical protein FJX74_18395, partial [Armatimonadetes bacterium]|nr:hypothetical protein [Armatimonadota bacterium]
MRCSGTTIVGCLLSAGLTYAAPAAVRSGQGWSITPVPTQADWDSLQGGPSLAAGKTPDLRPVPGYAYAVDADDAKQLTDGVLAGDGQQMHTDRRAVGWAYTPYVRVTVDLGSVQPVGQVLWRQASLSKENTLPRQIILSLSADGDSFHSAMRVSRKVHPDDDPALTFEPVPAEPPALYALTLRAGYQARYVRLDLATEGHVIADELAVVAGPANLPALPPTPQGEREWLDNVFDRRDQFTKLIAPGNLAAGLTLRYSPQPGYALTTDATDPA